MDDEGDKEIISSWPPDSPKSLSVNECCIEATSNDKTVKSKDCLLKKSRSSQRKNYKEKKHFDNAQKIGAGLKVNECLAEVGLAKWWRSQNRSVKDVHDLQDCTPHSILHHMSKTMRGKQFMKEEITRIKRRLQSETDLFHRKQQYAAIASYYEKLQMFQEARNSINEALDDVKICLHESEFQEEINQYLWLQHRILKQCEIEEKQIQALKKVSSEMNLKMPGFTSVERKSANELSLSEFYDNYSLQSKPVVITDLADKITTVPWSLNYIKKKAGHCQVDLKKLQQKSIEWARLETSHSTTVAEFIDSLQEEEDDDKAAKDKHYLFDYSLPLHCPNLAEELVVPKYFANNFLQRTNSGSLYSQSWPSLFIAPKGIRSELHIDAFSSNFWMALFSGKKRWVFFSKEDTPLLYPQYPHSMDPVFDVDLQDPDFQKHPLLSLTHPIECVLQPGEVLFVPSGCPHRVENLEQSVAISANFVDHSNFQKVKEQLKINSLICHRSCDLLQQFESERFDYSIDTGLQHLPLRKLQKQP